MDGGTYVLLKCLLDCLPFFMAVRTAISISARTFGEELAEDLSFRAEPECWYRLNDNGRGFGRLWRRSRWMHEGADHTISAPATGEELAGQSGPPVEAGW